MVSVKMKVSVSKILLSLFSISLFSLCYFLKLPLEIPHDSQLRFSFVEKLSEPSFGLFFFEPFSIFVAFISPNVEFFFLFYTLIALFLASALTKVPLYLIGLFLFTPQGWLLAFNITPSLIAFTVINSFINSRLKTASLVFGLLNNVVAFLAILGNLLYKIWFASWKARLLYLLAGSSIFVFAIFVTRHKIEAYSLVDGNFANLAHVLISLLSIFPCVFYGKKPEYRILAIMYFGIITLFMVLSVKMASRIAFGADLLALQFYFYATKQILILNFPKNSSQ